MAAAEALAGVALALGLYALLYYNFVKGPTCKNETSLRGKTVLITGGNTGIGKATALDLARRGARVILACRDRGRGESAVYDIRRESGNNEVLFMSLDLASFKSVRAFAAAFLRSEPRLDILINNAGGNTGIGKATALDLARRGARVILACRDRGRGESAVYDIRRESGNNEVLFMSLDLASFKSVRAFAAAFLRSEPRLHILINNAGLGSGSRSEDGLNLAFQVNHLSHFLLTHLVLERMKQCAPSRVVVVASSAHQSGKIDFQNIHKPVDGQLAALQSYCNSKLANVLFTRELANRLEGTNVTCYAVHPGLVKTDFFRHVSVWLMPLFLPIMWLFSRDTTSGAQTSIYCATEEGIEKYSGRYFANCRLHDPRPHARDDAVAKKLWEVSKRMVGLAN